MSIDLVDLQHRVAFATDLFSTKERDLMLASLDVVHMAHRGHDEQRAGIDLSPLPPALDQAAGLSGFFALSQCGERPEL